MIWIGDNGGPDSNITIEDNLFEKCIGQSCVQVVGDAPPSSFTNINVNWNSFQWGALYAVTLDGVADSEEEDNYSFDCRFGNEVDSGEDRSSGTTETNNYITMDQYGCGASLSFGGGGGCNLFFCQESSTLNPGCISGNNWVNDNNEPAPSGSNVETFFQDYNTTYTGPNYCWNGCECNGVSNCTASAPP